MYNKEIPDIFTTDTTVEPLLKRHYSVIRNEVFKRSKKYLVCIEILGYEVEDDKLNYYIRTIVDNNGKFKPSAFVFEMTTTE